MGRGILDLRGGTGGTDLVLGKELIGLVCLSIGAEGLREGGGSPFLIDNEDWDWGVGRNDSEGFFSGNGGCFEALIFVGVFTIDLDLIRFVVLFVLVRLSRKVDDGGEKSVSSKFNESDFDVIDNKLALRWSR